MVGSSRTQDLRASGTSRRIKLYHPALAYIEIHNAVQNVEHRVLPLVIAPALAQPLSPWTISRFRPSRIRQSAPRTRLPPPSRAPQSAPLSPPIPELLSLRH